MTELQILNLAYMAQLEIWKKEKELLKRLPDSSLAKSRERLQYSRVLELEERIAKLTK